MRSRVVPSGLSRAGAVVVVVAALFGCAVALHDDAPRPGEWPSYGNDPGGTRYSPLGHIDRANVMHLRVAWTYRTGEPGGAPPYAHIAFEATPLMVDGTLFLSTPYNRVIALDAETGARRWMFDPEVDPNRRLAIATSRGVSAWLDPAAARGAPCRRRIFVATIDARLIALDAVGGTPCADFATAGTIDLKQGIKLIDAACCYQVTSPPAIVNGLVVVGSSIGDNRSADMERGVVRAYDAWTGALRWSFDPIPARESDPARATWGGDSWRRTGAANVWSVMSVDEARAPRSLGLRRAGPARARERHARWADRARGRGRHEDGAPLRAASRDRHAAVPRGGTPGPAQHRARRGRVARPAVPGAAAAAGALAADGRGGVGDHAGRARGVPRAAERSPL